MRSVFGLRLMPVFRNKETGKWGSERIASLTYPPPEKGLKSKAVYTLLPSAVAAGVYTKTHKEAYKYIFVQKPAIRILNKEHSENHLPFFKSAIYKITPVVTVIISICTLYGLYCMMIMAAPPPSYFSASLATPSQLSLPKKKPSQIDAAASEYQHAITTEWVAAADTAAISEAKAKKGKEGRNLKNRIVTVTASRFLASEKKGIRNLELKVMNGSGHMLEQIILQVEFLKANGELIHLENYTARKVPAHGFKNIKVPAGTKGKKIAYRILEVKSHSYTTTLQHI